MPHVLRALGILLCLLVLVAGCGGPSRRPAAEVPGYRNLELAVGQYDFSPLAGRRILLDPGHGGRFRGAVGPGGLTEAEVNLGVALYLRGLLEWADATVFMTRTADFDLVTAADSSLAADLAARVALADSLEPDVFVSIHHNSNAAYDPVMNETQTYYPTGREGADLDLARAIHKHMVLALEIAPARIMGGNFHVLRNAPVPAVLGEPAMISNPVIEGRLTLAKSHELEAKAYFLGLLDYFAGGTPQWVTDLPDTVDTDVMTWIFDPGRPEAPGLDPASIEVNTTGWSLAADARTLRLWPGETPPDEVTVQARNLAGRATPIRRHVLRSGDQGGPIVSGLVREGEHGRALLVYETREGDLTQRAPLRLGHRDLPETAWIALPIFPGRRGWILVPPGPWQEKDAFIGESGERHPIGGLGSGQLTGARWRPLSGNGRLGWRRRWPPVVAAPVSPPELSRLVLDPRAPVAVDLEGAALWLEADGALPIFADRGGRTPWQDAAAPPPDTLVWEPLLPALINKTVVIDPRGGASLEQGRGPLGTRGADLNLRVAERLAALLRGAGCRVELTRTNESWVPDDIKVLRANLAAADLYLAVTRGDTVGHVEVRHHPGSAEGHALAQQVRRAMTWLPVAVRGGHDYVLRHTACPALLVALPSVTGVDAAAESRLADPTHNDVVARSLLLAVAATWQDPETVVLSQLLRELAEPRMIPLDRIDWCRWDGNFTWLAPDSAAVVSCEQDPALPAAGARHTVELHAGPSWQLWALHRDPQWRAQLLLENR